MLCQANGTVPPLFLFVEKRVFLVLFLPTIRLLLEKSRAASKDDHPLIIAHTLLDFTEHDLGQMLPAFGRRALPVAQNYFFIRHKYKIAPGRGGGLAGGT